MDLLAHLNLNSANFNNVFSIKIKSKTYIEFYHKDISFLTKIQPLQEIIKCWKDWTEREAFFFYLKGNLILLHFYTLKSSLFA